MNKSSVQKQILYKRWNITEQVHFVTIRCVHKETLNSL